MLLTSDVDVNFAVPAEPPVPTIPPGVFDQTGGDRIGNGAQFGLCLGILGKRGLLRARRGGGCYLRIKGVLGGDFRTGNGVFCSEGMGGNFFDFFRNFFRQRLLNFFQSKSG